ncbi:hypothetical protein QBC47DRAFT_362063 [Echria macrotheca]|uniref:Secreted protein n=1 Tax=Echria macrotheca TaxID=438768 RepID=A0AAJ0FAE7_9PEZI|nr:hypothetical protein QBC47DRAFT_362063 [Echria macrotheca]
MTISLFVSQLVAFLSLPHCQSVDKGRADCIESVWTFAGLSDSAVETRASGLQVNLPTPPRPRGISPVNTLDYVVAVDEIGVTREGDGRKRLRRRGYPGRSADGCGYPFGSGCKSRRQMVFRGYRCVALPHLPGPNKQMAFAPLLMVEGKMACCSTVSFKGKTVRLKWPQPQKLIGPLPPQQTRGASSASTPFSVWLFDDSDVAPIP